MHYHLLSGSASRKITIGNKIIPGSKCEKLLGMELEYITWVLKNELNLCKKQLKTFMLCQDLHYQWFLNRWDFLICHLLYFPVVWMFYSQN